MVDYIVKIIDENGISEKKLPAMTEEDAIKMSMIWLKLEEKRALKKKE